MNRLDRIALFLLVGGLICLPGCAKEAQGPVTGLSRSEADSLNAQNAKFESSEDPAFTAQTRFSAGQLAESQGAAQAAIEQYKAALKIDPHHQPSIYRLAVVYAQVHAYPQAIAAWKEYLKETHESSTAYANLGFCYELAGQASDAEAAYKAGIEKDPKNTLCRVNYGLMLTWAGRAGEGMEQLQTVLTAAQAHYNVGSVYEQLGKLELAQSEYRKALQLDPSLVEAKNRLATLGQRPAPQGR